MQLWYIWLGNGIAPCIIGFICYPWNVLSYRCLKRILNSLLKLEHENGTMCNLMILQNCYCGICRVHRFGKNRRPLESLKLKCCGNITREDSKHYDQPMLQLTSNSSYKHCIKSYWFALQIKRWYSSYESICMVNLRYSDILYFCKLNVEEKSNRTDKPKPFVSREKDATYR